LHTNIFCKPSAKQVSDTLAEIAARAEAMASRVEEQVR
jgi:hypothetical protein